MTRGENERLAIVETKVDALDASVQSFGEKLTVVSDYVVAQQAITDAAAGTLRWRQWLASFFTGLIGAAVAIVTLGLRVAGGN